jgi:hypothetical protein
VKLKPETLEAHRARHARQFRTRKFPDGSREATLDEKKRWLAAPCRAFTRNLYEGVPLANVPLYHNGHDFYLLTS